MITTDQSLQNQQKTTDTEHQQYAMTMRKISEIRQVTTRQSQLQKSSFDSAFGQYIDYEIRA